MTLPDPIAVEDFLRPPERAAATISPDGTRIAFLPRGRTGSTSGSPTSTATPSHGASPTTRPAP